MYEREESAGTSFLISRCVEVPDLSRILGSSQKCPQSTCLSSQQIVFEEPFVGLCSSERKASSSSLSSSSSSCCPLLDSSHLFLSLMLKSSSSMLPTTSISLLKYLWYFLTTVLSLLIIVSNSYSVVLKYSTSEKSLGL